MHMNITEQQKHHRRHHWRCLTTHHHLHYVLTFKESPKKGSKKSKSSKSKSKKEEKTVTEEAPAAPVLKVSQRLGAQTHARNLCVTVADSRAYSHTPVEGGLAAFR